MSTEVQTTGAPDALYVVDPQSREMSRFGFDRGHWLQLRRGAIGSSELGAILGLNSFSSGWEVWASKLDMLDDWEGNDATDSGRILEPAILDFAEQSLGSKLTRNVFIRHNDLPLAATCDAITETWRPVEAKATGIVGPIYGTWGDAGTDEVPDQYLIQVHAQLMCTMEQVAYLFALIPGRGFVEYQIEANAKVHEAIGNKITDWWERHIVQRLTPPTEQLPALDVVKRLRKTKGKVITGTPELERLVNLRASQRDLANGAEKAADALETQIRMMLGDAEGATLPSGKELELKTIKRKGYSVEPGEYTQLGFKKVKEAA